jgi:hypothetical protein
MRRPIRIRPPRVSWIEGFVWMAAEVKTNVWVLEGLPVESKARHVLFPEMV